MYATYLVLRVGWEELAVEMGGKDDAAGGAGVLCCDEIGEAFGAIGGFVCELVLLDFPVKCAKRVSDIGPHKRVVLRVG